MNSSNNKHTFIPASFADIFTGVYKNGTFDRNVFYINRDNFFQYHNDLIKHDNYQETIQAFQNEVFIENDFIQCFALATARYYCRIWHLPIPFWLKPENTIKLPCLVPINGEARNIQAMISDTPPEFLDVGIIYPEKNLRII